MTDTNLLYYPPFKLLLVRVGVQNDYPDGRYVKCKVLGGATNAKGVVELSLRASRLEGNMNDDRVPELNEIATAYVVTTTKHGCFVRLSRSVEGRIILKELSDDFIPNPPVMFPPGRLIVGKVKNVKSPKDTKKHTTMVDIDMRESVLLANGNRITMDDIQLNFKYTGVITRVESYGVFVRIDNSDISGLAHVSECSDTYIKNIFDLYNPGDFVKLVVISMDKERDTSKGQRRLAFSLKASNFIDDVDSDDESSSSSSDEDMGSVSDDNDDENSMDSEDEAFASKLAKKIETQEEGMESEDGDDDDESSDGDDKSENSTSDSERESSDGEDDESDKPSAKCETLSAMETDVGFDWGAAASKPTKPNLSAQSSDEDESSSSDSSEDESDDADSGFKSSHKARKKAATKKREEEETSRRESALADGTADEAPETTVDFERLVASSPNSSEVWIKYMAFHLSLADIISARNVADRAFQRIEFRQEGEKVSSSN